MANHSIIDRRKNPGGKNLPNRKRFIDRVKGSLKDKMRESINGRSITSNDDEEFSISSKDISEPNFGYDPKTGSWEHIVPGNKDFVPNDTIDKPKGSGGNPSASDSGEGEDDFIFSLTKEEYLDIVFEGLDLPNLVKKSDDAAKNFKKKRSGHSKEGSHSSLDLVRSLKNSLGRRIALGFPVDNKIRELEEQITNESDQEIISGLLEEIESLKIRRNAVTFLDPIDIRYRRFENVPIPSAKAVMFCGLDVSGSMTEKRKEIAKRFFMLLYLFLERKFEKVDIVFIRHTDTAKEVDEETFFYSRETGGTVISSALQLTLDIINERYSDSDWNRYLCFASDGDNVTSDNEVMLGLIEQLLPKLQYCVYAEVCPTDYSGIFEYVFSNASKILEKLIPANENLAVIRLDDILDVVPSFREVFASE